MVESIEEYVKTKEKRLEAKSSKIRDPKIFDWNYVPPKPLMRDEVKTVIDALLRYRSTGIANHILIVGSRGSGKTLSVVFLKELLESRGLDLVYVNCRLHNTSYKILAHLLGVRARGLSFDELAARFTDKYGTGTVVILDEVDLISERDKNKDILYFLSRADPAYMTILLSNSPSWATTLDTSVQSTLQPEHVYFRPYTALELRKILSGRAAVALKTSASRVLNEIAAMTASLTDSDVRVAIKTLYYWALEPGVTLKENFERARRDVVVDVVKNLSDRNLLILRAATNKEIQVKQAYEAYRRLCTQYRQEPYSYVYFCTSLSYLQSLGLVMLMTTKLRRTYAKSMQLTFSAEILDTFWRLRFG